jgi:MFS family permease
MPADTMTVTDMAEVERSTLRLVCNRCIPLVVLGFILSYLDRVNVGFAAITANKELGLTAATYGYGAGLVSIGYAVFELPSNLALERFGARRWMARIMITWGIIGCAMVFVNGPLSFYTARFLLGAAEAGFFPGVILYLTYWLPRRHRARYIGLFALAIPLASVIGSPISGLLLGMDGFFGMKGWQWLYILEAVPAVLLGFAFLFFLTDRPHQATWLNPVQRHWLESTLEAERLAHQEAKHTGAMRMLLDTRVLVLAAIFFLTGVPSYGLSYWTPQVVKSFGLSNAQTGIVSAIPFVFGCVAMIWWGNRSDRKQERAWHTAIAAFVGFLGLAVGAYVGSPLVQLLSVCISAAGIFGIKGPWLAMISEAFSDRTAAAGIAWVSTLGSLSGFAAPAMMGAIIQGTGSYRLGLLALGVNSLLGGMLVLWWGMQAGKSNPAFRPG